MVDDSQGNPLTEGPQTRIPSRAQRRGLNKRDDNTCQFPGCDTTRRLHAHHVVHWINGGPTELENLVLLCSFHHHTVHEGGWNITTTTIPGRFGFINPEGTQVGVDVFRGRLTALTNNGPPDTINRLSGERITDMDWLITVICHNDTARQARRKRQGNQTQTV